LPLPEGLLHTYYYYYRGEYYWEPGTVLALKLNSDADDVEPLENFDLKAVHSIRIPYTESGLGHDWDVLLNEEKSILLTQSISIKNNSYDTRKFI